ncbi:hypothetical protein JCM10908_007028 [Rhodotorula pacifica]|uniref:uncharacterized protein n=1 Tax=Rhodotorula pacifica TaxID=1495444 RepID=UPI00316FD2F7
MVLMRSAHARTAESLTRHRASSSSPNRMRTSPGPHPSKRPRTRLSPLESLASTATNILSSQAHQSVSTAAPSRSAMSLASLVSQPEASAAPLFDATIADRPASASGREAQSHRRMGRGSWPGTTGEDREKPRRASAAPVQPSAQHGSGRTETKGALPGQGGFPAAPEAGADGLGRRRGHRPPAVSTSATHASARPFTAAPNPSNAPSEPVHRNSIGTIPSVLVGGAMEAEYTAQLAREWERERELQQQKSRPSSSGPRRESVTSGSQGPAASTSAAPPSQPPIVSSSTYYIRPNQPFAPASQHYPRASSFSAIESQGPRGSIAAALPPGPPRHLTSAHRLSHESISHGPPGQNVVPPPHGHHVLQPSYSMGPPPIHPPPPPPGMHVEPDFDPSIGSKQAFLALFSSFYDSLGDSRVLASTLDSQVQRAGSLLHTLSSAEAALEALVDQRINACRNEWDARWRQVEQRLQWLEERIDHGAGPHEGGLEQRLGRLEETVARRSSESDSASNVERRSSGGSISRGTGRPSAPHILQHV